MPIPSAHHISGDRLRRVHGWPGAAPKLAPRPQSVPAVPAASGAPSGKMGTAALAAFAVRVASAGIAYLTQVVLARWMGGAEYGIFVWVWVWVLILGGLSSFGLQISIIRFVPEYHAMGQSGLLAGVLRAGRAIPLAVATATAGLCATGLLLWGEGVPPDYRWPLLIALGCLPLYTLTDVQDGIGRGRGWIGVGLVPPYVLRPLLILSGMVVAHLAGLPMLATTAALSALAATWIAGLVQYVLLQRKLKGETQRAKPVYDLPGWFATSLPIWFIAACELALQNLDVLVVTRYADPASVGIYFASLKTIGLIAFVNYAVGSAIAGRLSALKAQGDHAGIQRMVAVGARWTFWPSLLGAGLLLLAGRPLLAIFGSGFAAGYPLMFVLAFGLVARAAVGPAEFVLRMLGEQKVCALVSGLTAIADLTLSFSLAPSYGAMGVAVANAASLTLMSGLFYLIARWRLGFDISAFATKKKARR